MDIAISYSFHNNEPIDKTISVLNNDMSKLCVRKDKFNIQTQQILTSWSNHVSSWTNDSKLPVHLIRYEDMLDYPLNSFKSAVDFLNLKYGELEIIEAINKSSFDTLKVMETSDGFKERGIHSKAFFRQGKSNEWKTELSLAQIDKIVNHHYKIMKRFGY